MTLVSHGRPVGVISARTRVDLPAALRRWLGPPGSSALLETAVVTGNSRFGADFGLTWTRKRAGKMALRGFSKGVWDCEAGLLMLLYAEESLKAGRPAGSRGPCQDPLLTLERHAMRTRVCDERSLT